MERFLVDGRPVFVWPSAFTPPECDYLGRLLPWPGAQQVQTVLANARSEAWILAGLLDARLKDGPPRTWLTKVTLTRSVQLPWHCDTPLGAHWKVCIYIDDVERGGIVFRDAAKQEHRPRAVPQGTIVMFDIDLEHRTDDCDPTVLRRVIGMRAATP